MNKNLFILATAALLSVFAGCKKVENPDEGSSAGGNGTAVQITAIAPQSGAVGTTVVISGKNFSATDTKVYFGEAQATVSAATETSLTVSAPENELGAVTVKVTVAGKSATTSFTYTEPEVLAPVIDDQSALEGKTGSRLTFIGENLGTDASAYVVKFNDVVAEILDVTAESITVKVPASDGTSSAIVTVTPVSSSTALYEGMFSWTFARTVTLGAISGELFEANKALAIPVTITADEDAEELTADDVTVTFVDVNDPAKTYVATEVTVEENGITPIIPNKLKGEFKVKVEVAEALPVETATSFVVYYLPKYRVDVFAGLYGRTWLGDGTVNITAGGYFTAPPTSALATPEGLTFDKTGNLWITTRGGSKGGNNLNHSIAKVDMVANTLKIVYRMTEDVYPFAIVVDSKGVAHVASKTNNGNKVQMGKLDGTNYTKYTVEGLNTVTQSSEVQELDLLIDDNDNIYLADRDGCRVIVFKDGVYKKEYSSVYNGANIQINSIAWDSKKENIFIGAQNDWVILKLNVATGALEQIAGTGTVSIEYNTDKSAPKTNNFTNGNNPLEATLGSINGMVCDANGYLYFNDIHSAAVRVIIPGKGGDYKKGVVRTILGQPGVACVKNMTGAPLSPAKCYYYIDGTIDEAFFSERGKLALDASGNLYTAGNLANAVRRITPIAE